MQQVSFFSSDDRIATNEEQATGKKREELDAIARGESRFSLTPLKSAFGTYTNPVIVPSGMSSRVVGCQGGVEGVRSLVCMFVLCACVCVCADVADFLCE